MGCVIEALFVADVIKEAVGRSWRWTVGWLLKEPSSTRSRGGWGSGSGSGLGADPIWLLVTPLAWTAWDPPHKQAGGRKTLFLTQSLCARSSQPFGLAHFSQQSFSSHSTPPSHSSAAHCSSSSRCGCSFTHQNFRSALAWRFPRTQSLWRFHLYFQWAWCCYLHVDSRFLLSSLQRSDFAASALHRARSWAVTSRGNHNTVLPFPALSLWCCRMVDSRRDARPVWWPASVNGAGGIIHGSTVCPLWKKKDETAQSRTH